MNKIILFLMLFFFIPQAFCDCDWSKIKVNADGSRTYPLDLHLCVGQLVKQVPLLQQEIVDLNKTITLDQLALKDEQTRTQLWLDTSLKLTDQVNKYESLKSSNNLLYYGLGVATIVLSAWVVGQVK